MSDDGLTSPARFRLRLVPGDGPGRPPVAATVGLPPEAPDLVCVGVEPPVGTDLLNAVADVVVADPTRARVDERIRLPAGLPCGHVILGPVVAPWAVAHAIQDAGLDRIHGPESTPMLQVLLTDDTGRGPDDDGVDRSLLARQPVLGDPHAPWRVPHGVDHLAPRRRGWPGDAPTAPLLLPISDAGHPIARDEVVPAIALGDDLWAVAAQPTLADWCAVGAVVRGRLEQRGPDVGGVDVEVVRFRSVEQASPRIVSRWAIRAASATAAEQVLATLETSPLYPYLAIGRAALPHAVTIAAQASDGMRLDQLLREHASTGLIERRPLFHEPGLRPHVDA